MTNFLILAGFREVNREVISGSTLSMDLVMEEIEVDDRHWPDLGVKR